MKKLITGATIRELYAAEQMSLTIIPAETIITPEARTIASELGVEVIEGLERDKAQKGGEAPPTTALKARIRESVIAQLPNEQRENTQLIDQLVDKVIKQGAQFPAKEGEIGSAGFEQKRAHSGVKVVKGDTLKYGLFEGAGSENSVGIVDLIGAEDQSPMAAGFMTWQNAFFPWTLTYDEINYVVEGELHIRTNGETIIGKKGDLLFIPKNSSIEFGTPTHVRFLFVSYPVNWAD